MTIARSAIFQAYVARWSLEVSFEEARAQLGVQSHFENRSPIARRLR